MSFEVFTKKVEALKVHVAEETKHVQAISFKQSHWDFIRTVAKATRVRPSKVLEMLLDAHSDEFEKMALKLEKNMPPGLLDRKSPGPKAPPMKAIKAFVASKKKGKA